MCHSQLLSKLPELPQAKTYYSALELSAIHLPSVQLYCIFTPVALARFCDRRYACLLFGLTSSPLTCVELNLAAPF